jgi:hypothetical protein
MLGERVALVSRFSVPLERQSRVPTNAETSVVEVPQLQLGIGFPLFR